MVSLLSGNAVGNDEPSPLRVNVIGIRQAKNGCFDSADDSVRLSRSEAEPIVLDWPRTNRPELDENLRSDAHAIFGAAVLRYCFAGLAMLRVGTMNTAKDDVRIGKNVHYRFQSSSRV